MLSKKTRETNNKANSVLQIGTPPTPSATIHVNVGSVTALQGQVVTVTGSGFYDFNTVPGTQDYPVQGGAVTVEVLNVATQTVVGTYAGTHTTVNGGLSQPIVAPLAPGTYTIRAKVTDFSA